jgi:predicted murein hydrolase (TIGR00659 family)
MSEFFGSLGTLGVAITVLAYVGATWLRAKVNHPLVNPMLITIIILIAFLKLTDIDYETYNSSARILSFFLTPVTVCLAVPLYEELNALRKNAAAILLGILAGVLAGLSTTVLLARAMHLDATQLATLLPRSITTPIGLGLSEKMGGIAALSVALIVITGIWGNLVGRVYMKLIRVTDPVAAGVGIGTASHGLGTALAFEMGEVQGAMSSLSIAVAGVFTVVLAPLFLQLG